MRLPDTRPLVTFVGDDFTGSSAVSELMHFAGLPSVLFLDVPSKAQLERFRDHLSIGIATVARAEKTSGSRTVLPPATAFRIQ